MPADARQVAEHSDPVAVVQSLFLKHTNAIRGFLFAVSGNGHLVDDVLHSTFLAITAKAGDYDPARPFVPWARGFAKKELLKATKLSSRGPLLLSPEAMDHLDHSAPEFAVDSVQIGALLACLEELAPRAKQAIAFRYREALLPAEIARRMSLAVASVNVMLSRARATLRQCVELKLRREE